MLELEGGPRFILHIFVTDISKLTNRIVKPTGTEVQWAS